VADPHFVAALDLAFDFSLDRQTGAVRLLELAGGRSAARQAARQRQPARRRHHNRLDAFAHGHFDDAVGVFQLGDVDRGFSFAADIDKRHVGTDRHDRALDGLSPFDAFRLQGRLEQRREIFFVGVVHGLRVTHSVSLARHPHALPGHRPRWSPSEPS
jgi:hypothetical protein